MQLKKIERYSNITIQCHDNPDADAIASGFGLYMYFKSRQKKVNLIYSGHFQIQKPNLKLMIENLQIPIEYRAPSEEMIKGILITVDCQYGAGNVTKFYAEEIAIFDHHQKEITNVPNSTINSNLGSCSTLIWSILKKHKFSVNENINLATALYYGLYSDTNQFTEIYNPLDRDMQEELKINKSLIRLFRNSNLTLEELGIAGIALLRCIYNDNYMYAIIKAQPCDPNILGLISDFLLQVDEVHSCVVYNTLPDGYKLSVRSCVKEVKASELAEYLTKDIGSGGGHFEKAGGVISNKLYENKYPTLNSEAYFSERMNEYFDSYEIIYAEDHIFDLKHCIRYQKRKIPIGYVKANKLLTVGTQVTVRTLEEDIDIVVEEDTYFIIGINGEVSFLKKEIFDKIYCPIDIVFKAEIDYQPTIKDRMSGESLELMQFAKICIPIKESYIFARTIKKAVKIFTKQNSETYMSGRVGDYLAVSEEDMGDPYIIKQDIFDSLYEQIN